MSRETEWVTFLQDFSLAFKVHVLYSKENYASQWEMHQLALCHWLFSQFDVKFKQKANILENVLRFKRVLLCSFGLILVESTDTWLWNCSMNFIWEQKHLGFQLNFSKITSLFIFFVCLFITVKFKVKPAEAKNRLHKIQSEALRLGPADISSMWRLLYDDDDSRNWDFG